MIFVNEDEIAKTSAKIHNMQVADLIARLHEEVESGDRVINCKDQMIAKLEKKIKSLEKKLGMWNTLKG